MANFHECMSCGRSLDAEKSRLGARNRFCSNRCVDYYEKGWFFDGENGVYGQVSTSHLLAVESARRSKLSQAGKRRGEVSRKAALAESWKKYKAKKKATESSEQ